MNDTSFELPSEDRSRVMPIHEHTADGGMKLSSFMWPDSSEFFAGGHGLYSSARDYARFLRAILRGGELDGSRILQEATVELALSDQLDGVPLPEFVPTQAAWLMCDVISFPVRQSWGYGFQLTLEDLPGMRRAGTVFWSGILNTYFWIDRQTGVAATVMTQLQPLFDPALLQSLATFESTLYAGS
jgi:CubicO group peptidase (beta-lactamase class C family)